MKTKPHSTSSRWWWPVGFAWASLLVIWLAQFRVFYFWPPLVGGDAWGLGFGFAATAALVLSTFYSMRKVHLNWGIGRLGRWLEIHIYLGAFALVLTVAHSGYRFHATVPNLALLFLFLVVASGLVGWMIYAQIPLLKAERLKYPVLPELVAGRLSEINQRLSELCSGRHKAFLDLYNEGVIPLFRSRGREPAHISIAPPPCFQLEPEEAGDYTAAAQLLEEAKNLFLDLDQHLRFLRRLRLWLYFHVPLSVGLIVFSVAHIVSVIWY